MAVKSLKNDDTLKISVWLKDSRSFIGCNILPTTFAEGCVQFMNKYDRVVCIPLHNVDMIEFYNEK